MRDDGKHDAGQPTSSPGLYTDDDLTVPG